MNPVPPITATRIASLPAIVIGAGDLTVSDRAAHPPLGDDGMRAPAGTFRLLSGERSVRTVCAQGETSMLRSTGQSFEPRAEAVTVALEDHGKGKLSMSIKRNPADGSHHRRAPGDRAPRRPARRSGLGRHRAGDRGTARRRAGDHRAGLPRQLRRIEHVGWPGRLRGSWRRLDLHGRRPDHRLRLGEHPDDRDLPAAASTDDPGGEHHRWPYANAPGGSVCRGTPLPDRHHRAAARPETVRVQAIRDDGTAFLEDTVTFTTQPR